MPKSTTTNPKAAASPKSPTLLPCRIVTNGTLYQGAHHAKNKLMSIPEDDAKALEKQGAVEILPGLA